MGDARAALLGKLIDHAPLFPPASLPIEEAIAEDRRFRAGPFGWLANRFVCSASTLAAAARVGAPLSVVLDEPLSEGPADAQVEAVETSDKLLLTPGLGAAEVYVETNDPTSLAGSGYRAKVRCGGATVPSVAELAEFVTSCRKLGLPFKATAGLHHPVRTDSRHGFLNLAAAAVFGDEEEALSEEDPASLSLTPEAFTWRGRSAGAEEIARIRRGLFVGFGSCSAQEPADELVALGFLAS
jgi:hypothetical protein